MKLPSLPPKLLLFLLLFLSTVNSQEEEEENLKAELEMAELELQDDCENLANTYKLSLTTNTFSERIKVRKAHGQLLKIESINLKQFEDFVPPELFRNWTILTSSGNEMLEDHDWSTLVTFDGDSDELVHTIKIHCQNNTGSCILMKNAVENILEDVRNKTTLKRSWHAWQLVLSSRVKEFSNVLNLVNKAASQNGKEDATAYWEMLVDKEDAYTEADMFWEEIKPLYFKLQNFVKTRLFRFYNITSNNSEIPVYLLGPNFGNDWSHVAEMVLPYPQIYFQAETYVKKMSIQDIYKLAEETTQDLSLGPLGNNFWSKSLFNMTFCENYLLSYCTQEHTELLTCDKTSWVSYLNAFEVGIDVTLRNLNYLALAQLNLRHSVIDEAVKGLGPVLAIKNLRHKGVTSSTPHEMTELLLIALRVLPKLPYYLVADKWRLAVLEKGGEDLVEKWWSLRKEYQGVEGITNSEADFIGDPYITSNTPYLSKFLGTLLQFQLLKYYTIYMEDPNENVALNFANDENFLTMLRERPSYAWPDLFGTYYGIYDLSASALLDYFAPLNDFLDSAPLNQIFTTAPPTPTTPTPTTTTTESTTIRIKQEKSLEVRKDTAKIKEAADDDEKSVTHTIHHEHIEENLEGPNPTMEKASMYIGLCLLVGVAVIIVVFIISKKMKSRKRANNRRFET